MECPSKLFPLRENKQETCPLLQRTSIESTGCAEYLPRIRQASHCGCAERRLGRHSAWQQVPKLRPTRWDDNGESGIPLDVREKSVDIPHREGARTGNTESPAAQGADLLFIG